MVHHVGENELLDETKHGEILVSPDVVQSQLFLRVEKRNMLHLSQ